MVYQPLWRVRLRLLRKSAIESWGMFQESKIALTGLTIIVFYGLIGLVYPVLINTVWDPKIYDPVMGFDFQERINPAPPSPRHLLGTDPTGRDILSQLMASTKTEFVLGVFAALITVVIGTLVGTLAAYYGGFVDTFFMRLADVVLLFPLIGFLIMLSGLLGQIDFWTLALVLGIYTGFGSITIVLKSQALQIKVKPYIEAAKVAGGSHFHIIFSHIIPNVLPLSFLYMMFTVTSAIFSEAVLSFFGLTDIEMSWGLMINIANDSGYLVGGNFTRYWWLWVPSGLSITFLCAAFYLVGRGLDEVINPRLRKR